MFADEADCPLSLSGSHCTVQADSGVLAEIERDVPRSFPSHPFFSSALGQRMLRRVLGAYLCRGKGHGYCQGTATANTAMQCTTCIMLQREMAANRDELHRSTAAGRAGRGDSVLGLGCRL